MVTKNMLQRCYCVIFVSKTRSYNMSVTKFVSTDLRDRGSETRAVTLFLWKVQVEISAGGECI